MSTEALTDRHCKACAPGTPALNSQQVSELLSSLDGWGLKGKEIARTFSFTDFYESCPVLRADTPEQLRSRLLLADLTARILAQGLDLLGIAAPERM